MSSPLCFLCPAVPRSSKLVGKCSFVCNTMTAQPQNAFSASHHRAARVWRACSEEATPEAKDGDVAKPGGYMADERRWSEIDFGSLQGELQAIDDYIEQEGISSDNPWPIFLRGAAYESWGQTNLALAQYDLLAPFKAMLLVPELWVRRAYNSFKVGEVAVADRYHDIAQLIRADSVGNQLHFSALFEENFREHMPKHNGPVDSLQKGICNYCNCRPKDARSSIVVDIVASSPTPLSGVHASLWYLASCAKSLFTASIEANILSELDMKVARPHLDPLPENFDQKMDSVVKLYLGRSGIAEVEELFSKDGEECSVICALYLALYYDAFLKDASGRDNWLDVGSKLPQPENCSSIEDFMFWAVKNRLTVPPEAKRDLAPAQVPM